MNNIISTFYINSKINLEELYKNSSIDCILDYPYLRMPTQFGILYIFASGKVTSTEAKSIEGSKRAAQICLKTIQNAVIPKAKLFGYRIQSMRGICTLQSVVKNRKGTPR